MITALSWIPRGVTPKRLLPNTANDADVDRYLRIIQGESDVVDQEKPPEISAEDAAIIKKYDLDHYDDDTLATDEIIENDPYRVSSSAAGDETPIDEDDEILESDFLLIVGKYSEDCPTLECHLFDESNETIFVHHEILLPSFPLVIRWLDIQPSTGAQGSFAAIGSMRSEIEVWNLNIQEPICPTALLQFHTDSVPGLSWNLHNRAALLSASIDKRAAVWSLQTCQTASVFEINGECKACEWCPTNSTVFSVASTNGVNGFDVRDGNVFQMMQGVPIESIEWSSDGNQVVTSLTSGDIVIGDIRNLSQPVFNWKAHDGPANSIAVCKIAPVIASVGDDQICKIWSVTDQPRLIADENLNVGNMFTCSFCPDKPTLLAVGGMENGTSLWDIINVIESA